MTIQEYQEKCKKEYKMGLGLPTNYNYPFVQISFDGFKWIVLVGNLDTIQKVIAEGKTLFRFVPNGNPIETIPPIEIEKKIKYMIVGAYPSAQFITLPNGRHRVPIDNIDSPFSIKTETESAKKLDKMLVSIGINRNDCWITNLVKVFLIKEGHIRASRLENFLVETRSKSKYKDFAKKSMKWLYEELSIANPEIIITLGEEVIETILDEADSSAPHFDWFSAELKSLKGKCKPIKLKNFKDREFNILSLNHTGYFLHDDPHPFTTKEEKWNDFIQYVVPNAKLEILKFNL